MMGVFETTVRDWLLGLGAGLVLCLGLVAAFTLAKQLSRSGHAVAGWLAFGALLLMVAGGAALGFFTTREQPGQRLVGAGGLAAAALGIAWTTLFWRAGKRHERAFFVALTAAGALVLMAFGSWTYFLPEPRGSFFRLSHQIVRVIAALSGVAFVVGLMALLMPWTLDRLEGRGFVSFVSARHMRSKKSGFVTVISFLSIAGVGVSAFALCAVVSIMGGFGADLKRKILGNNAHIIVDSERAEGIGQWQAIIDTTRLVPGVEAATPVVTGEAMASSSSNTSGVLVRGVDPVTIGTVIDLLKNIEVGRFEYLENPEKLETLPENEPIGIGPGGQMYFKGAEAEGIFDRTLDEEVRLAIDDDDHAGLILGRELAKNLHVYVGDEVTLVSPRGGLGLIGLVPKSRRFRVAAIFYSGMYEYDSSHAYTTLEVAQDFLDSEGRVSAIELKARQAEEVRELTPQVRHAVLGLETRQELRVKDWQELNRNLFSALKLEKYATFIVLSLAITVASFCIICTLLLMVTEKSKEISILKALGASDGSILKIFMSEGMMIGGIGTVFGVVTGLAATLGLKWSGVRLDPDVYYVDRLPIDVDGTNFVLVALSALVITTVATLYPALAASRLRPVDGVRYE